MINDSNVFGGAIKKPSKELLDSIDLKLGFGLYVTEEDYENYVKGNELYVGLNLQYGYVLVVKEGTLNFYHYGPVGLTDINPSTFKDNENLSFCEGIYCYNADTHIPVSFNDKTSLYKGTYSGKYVECVFDIDGEEGFEKDSGNTKEYVLLTKSKVSVEVV